MRHLGNLTTNIQAHADKILHARSVLHKKTDDELFTVDVAGDDKSEHPPSRMKF